jgi:hypothetical protein
MKQLFSICLFCLVAVNRKCLEKNDIENAKQLT